MLRKDNDQSAQRFLKEALPLISTYFSGEGIRLAAVATSLGQDSDLENQDFGNYIRFRHAIACCSVLFPIVQRVESGLSTTTDTTRTETKGVIRGRLDIPRYIGRRSSSLSWPKTYPILMTSENPRTSENELVIRIFRTLLQRLSVAQFPTNSAEVALARRCKNWILNRMKRAPWVSIPCASSLPRLYMEACRRIARRQTGNEIAYLSLVSFIRDWRLVDESLASAGSSEKFIDSFLSFPADQKFFDRIYEIWCLHAVASSFIQLGGQLIDGPCKMTESRRKPIYVIGLAACRIEIWFQSSLPSERADWFYDSTGNTLRGIPDITVVANGNHRMIIDAKNKIVKGATRSEETYKMLGYFENFRDALEAESNWGVLAFISFNGFSRTLSSSNGRLLELISAHPTSSEDCTFMEKLKPILKAWVDRVSTASVYAV